jgi:hypothetical protein
MRLLAFAFRSGDGSADAAAFADDDGERLQVHFNAAGNKYLRTKDTLDHKAISALFPSSDRVPPNPLDKTSTSGSTLIL